MLPALVIFCRDKFNMLMVRIKFLQAQMTLHRGLDALI